MNASTIFSKARGHLRGSAERRRAGRLFSTHGPTRSNKHHIRAATDLCVIVTVVQL